MQSSVQGYFVALVCKYISIRKVSGKTELDKIFPTDDSGASFRRQMKPPKLYSLITAFSSSSSANATVVERTTPKSTFKPTSGLQYVFFQGKWGVRYVAKSIDMTWLDNQPTFVISFNYLIAASPGRFPCLVLQLTRKTNLNMDLSNTPFPRATTQFKHWERNLILFHPTLEAGGHYECDARLRPC